MTKFAKVTFDGSKWNAVFQGNLIASSSSREYVVNNIRNGKCRKAVALGVTDIEADVHVHAVKDVSEQPAERFNINERFSFVADLVSMIADKSIPSVVITGEGGLGKTHIVLKTIKEAGLMDTRFFLSNLEKDKEDEDPVLKGDYTMVKGFSTAKGLYRTLYENRDKIVIFDDCDSILKDPVALNLLKGALDSYDERWLSWNSEAIFGDNLPRSFKFVGQIIFISNIPMMKIDQAIRSRSMCVDLAMTDLQKIERMSHIITEDDFMPDFSNEIKTDALTFLSIFADQAREISLRTLIAIVKIRAKGKNWEKLAEYVLTN